MKYKLFNTVLLGDSIISWYYPIWKQLKNFTLWFQFVKLQNTKTPQAVDAQSIAWGIMIFRKICQCNPEVSRIGVLFSLWPHYIQGGEFTP